MQQRRHPHTFALIVLCLTPLACAQRLDVPEHEADHTTALVAEGDALIEQLEITEDGWGLTPPMHHAELFERLAFRFDAAAPIAIEARFSSDAGESWGEWQEVSVTWSEGVAHNAHVDVDVALPTTAQLRFMAPVEAGLTFLAAELLVPSRANEEEDMLAPEGQVEQGLAADGIVVTRSQWGAIARNCGSAHTPNKITVHHTVTPNNDAMSMPARMRQIQAFHIFQRGWCDVGYHFLVGQDGQVYQGRYENRTGAHASNANYANVGVSYIGNYQVAVPPSNMLDAGARIIRSLSQTYGIGLNRSRVLGHRQVGTTSTACPGDHLYARLGEILNRAATGVAAPSAPSAPPPPAVSFDAKQGDFNGDGKDDLITLSKNAAGGWADWAALELSTGSGFTSTTWAAKTPEHMRNGDKTRAYTTLVGDYNGDGKDDLATLSKNGGGGWSSWVAMELSTGSGFTSTTWGAKTAEHMRNGNNTREYKVLVGDFNGDGKDDLATLSKNGGGGWANWVAMELSTGSGFTSTTWNASTTQHMRNGGSDADYQVLVGDFNGDGKDDLATVTKNGGGGWANWIAMELSTGSGFSSTTWAAKTPEHMRNGGSGSDYRILVGDYNGDGKADLATVTKNGGGGWADWAAMELSSGTGFTSTTWTAKTPEHMRNGNNGRDYATLVGDFDGDGRDDLATVSKNGGGGWANWLALEISQGNGFASSTWGASTPTHLRNGNNTRLYAHRVGDFDGDGDADIATISPNGGGGWANWVALERSTGAGFVSQTWSASTPQHMRNGTP